MGGAARALLARMLAPVRAPAALRGGRRQRRRSTIEHEYLIALLLQLVNAGNLTPRHVEWVAGELDDWCQPLRLTLEPSSVTSFYVDLGSRTGLRRRSVAPLEGRVLFLDTRPLHALLMQSVALLEQKIKSQPLSSKTGRRSEQLALVTKLASQVDPEFKPFARRGERTSAVGTVDAIVGFAKISRLPARGRPQADAGERIPADLRRHDGARDLRTHAQREGSPAGAGETAARDIHGAWRTLGSEGREPDRIPPAGADERRQFSHAGHAGGDAPARPARLGPRHRAPHAAPHHRSRGDRIAGRRQRAVRRRLDRATQIAGCGLFGRR